MNDVIIVVNYIKASALNPKLFCSLCEEIGSEHYTLYYAQTGWFFGMAFKENISSELKLRCFL